MHKVKLTVVLVVLAVATMLAGVVSAQETDTGRVGAEAIRTALGIIAQETGLSEQEIFTQIQEGLTPSEVIVINGGDVDAVAQELTAAILERIDTAVADGRLDPERAARLQENLDDLVADALNGNLPRREPGAREPRFDVVRAALDAVGEQTGLEPRIVLEELRSGKSLVQVIEENGGDAAVVVAAAEQAATQAINEALSAGNMTQEQADELLAALPDVLTEALNGNLAQFREERREGRGDRGLRDTVAERGASTVLDTAAELTGLERREVFQAVRGGQTLAEVLEQNGVNQEVFLAEVLADANTRLNEAVSQGRITQARADELLARLEEGIINRLNAAPVGPPDAE